MAIELVKENIEYEQLLGENTSDNVIKAEYVIPDTHPDVYEILMLDSKPSIISAEVMQDKVYIEGQIVYNVLYLSKEEKYDAFSVSYTNKFTNYIDVSGAAHKMFCEPEVYIEHMEANIVNERKISIEGIVKLKAKVSKNYQFDIVKDIEGSEDVQLLKKPSSIDKIIGRVNGNIQGVSHIVIPVEKPILGQILKMDALVHKKSFVLSEGKVHGEAFTSISIIYKGKDSRDLECVSEDIPVSVDMELNGVKENMQCFGDIKLNNIEYSLKEDDLGESRIIDVEVSGSADAKIMSNETIDMIEDAYAPKTLMKMVRNDFQINTLNGFAATEIIVKDDLPVEGDMPRPLTVIFVQGKALITDKKLVDNKVVVDGILKIDVMYKTTDEQKYLNTLSEEMPFNTSIEIPGTKIDMNSSAQASVESIEAVVEGGVIAVKAVVDVSAKVDYSTNKVFIIDVQESEEEVPQSKASITIYVVQPGDTLWKIAKNYNTTIDNLVRVNDLSDVDNIMIGQKLIIPGRAIL